MAYSNDPADIACSDVAAAITAAAAGGDYDEVLTDIHAAPAVLDIATRVPLTTLEDLPTTDTTPTIYVSVMPSPDGEEELVDRTPRYLETFGVRLCIEAAASATNNALHVKLRALARLIADPLRVAPGKALASLPGSRWMTTKTVDRTNFDRLIQDPGNVFLSVRDLIYEVRD